MKKLLSTVLITILSASLIFTGCSKEPSSDSNNSNGTNNQQGTVNNDLNNTSKEDSNEKNTSSEEKVDGGILIRPMPSDISSLNILYETGDEGLTMLKPVYDPLYIVDKDEIRYYLAESRTISEDGLTITVKLKNNLKWHDGEAITADDIIFNFDFRNDPTHKSSSGTKVNGAAVAYEKVDELTIKLTLPSVSASYDATLGNMKLIPKHIYENEENIASSEKNMLGIGSGSYKVKEWKKGESLSLERFTEYYREKASLENVVYKIMPNESAQEIALQNGEINLYRISTQDKYDKYVNDDKYDVYSLDEGRINYMGFNSNSEVMKDIKAREAVALALNVDEIIEGAYGSATIAKPAKTVFCESNFYYSDIDGYKQDLDKAKQLVSELGLEEKTLKLVYNSSRPNMESCALIIQQQLKEVGIKLEVTGYETQGFFEKFFYTDLGDWDLGLNGYSTNADNQADEYMFSLEGFLSKNLCSTDEIAALWNEGDATNNREERARIYEDIQIKIKEAYSMYPISSPNFIFAVEKSIKGCDEINIVPIFEDYTKLYMVK